MKTTIVPTSTTNMTGFLIWVRGSSFFSESSAAWPRIWRSKRLLDWATPCATVGGPTGLVDGGDSGATAGGGAAWVVAGCADVSSGRLVSLDIRRTFRG